MVHKDEMCAIFKTLRSVDRIEILCGMFQLCVPQELRFIGSCLEDLIQKNYKLLYDAECIANDSKQLKDIARPLSKIDKEFCASLNTYLSLLHSDNTSCALSMFSILNELKTYFEVQLSQPEDMHNNNFTQNNEFMEDIILIFTMASYHPAFTITQRLRMYEVCKSLKDILKKGDSQNSEHISTFAENVEPQNVPVSIDVKRFRNQEERSEDVELEVVWTDRKRSSHTKSLCQIQHYQSQLLHAFPNMNELQSWNSYLYTTSSDCSMELPNLEKYFQNLTTLPICVLKCQATLNFFCNSIEGRSGSSSMILTDAGISLGTSNNCSSSSDDTEFYCDGQAQTSMKVQSLSVSKFQGPERLGHDLSSLSSSSFTSSSLLSPNSNYSRSPNSVSQSTSFSCSNSDRSSVNSRVYSSTKWGHSDMKTKSTGSLTNDRLISQHSRHHRHHHQHDHLQHLTDTKESVISNERSKAVETMRECEEVDSHLLMTKLLVSPCEGNSHGDQDCFPNCGVVHAGGDYIAKHNPCCIKHHLTDVSARSKNDKNVPDNQNCFLLPASDTLQPVLSVESNHLSICTGPAISGGKVLRPILGASVNQTCKMAADDIRILNMDSKSSNSIGVSSLPRASSCGVILQQDQELSSLASTDGTQMQSYLSNLHLPNSFPLDAFYSNVESRINFVHLPPYPHFNQQQGDCSHSQALPVPSIPPTLPPPQLINPSLVPPFSNNLQLNPPCTFCSSASLPPFSNYPPLWHPHLFFRSNGLLGPRFPHSSIRQGPGGMYLQAHFDYFPYNSPGMMVTSPPSVTVPSVPSTIASLPQAPHPQQLQILPKAYCHNCGSSGHTIDLCEEPLMLSMGQAAQFKLKTFPKNESSNC